MDQFCKFIIISCLLLKIQNRSVNLAGCLYVRLYRVVCKLKKIE